MSESLWALVWLPAAAGGDGPRLRVGIVNWTLTIARDEPSYRQGQRTHDQDAWKLGPRARLVWPTESRIIFAGCGSLSQH